MEGIAAGLAGFFEGKTEISFALLFGSRASGRAGKESDVDVAVYFRPSGPTMYVEAAEARYPTEDALVSELERILGEEVDLVVLNRAAATIAAAFLARRHAPGGG